MHVLVGGMPANDEVSTDVWQYRQSMPSSPTWCAWLNWSGCSMNSLARVTYDERPRTMMSPMRPPARRSTPTILTFARVLALRSKDLRHRMLTVVPAQDGRLHQLRARRGNESGRHSRSNYPICTML